VAEATLATGGIQHRPHLVQALREAASGTATPLAQPPATDLHFAARNVAVVRDGLVAVVKEGTGRQVFAGAAYSAAGKTGTAQAVTLRQGTKYDARVLQEHQRDHSLFAAFAPVEEPRIAVAVIVENAGWGAAAAAPIARRVFDFWLAHQYPNSADIQAVRAGTATAPRGVPLDAESLAQH
jgi:penicillin-binding protein 2